jgi:hypothetical protein
LGIIESMRRLVLLLPLLAATAVWAAPPRHFEVAASFVPAKKVGGDASVAVSFVPLDPDVRVNESPAPRLKLDLAQAVLIDRQAPAPSSVPDFDPLTAHYLDLAKPVLFPVAVGPAAPKGEQLVKGSVVYFYCSKREAWCRRGTTEVEIPVAVR